MALGASGLASSALTSPCGLLPHPRREAYEKSLALLQLARHHGTLLQQCLGLLKRQSVGDGSKP